MMRKVLGALFTFSFLLASCRPSNPAKEPEPSEPAVSTSVENTSVDTSSVETASLVTTSIGTSSSVATPLTAAETSVVTTNPTDADPLTGRPFEVVVPKSYGATKASPLLVVLHGYTGTGASIREYFALDSLTETGGFLTVYPDGRKDANGAQFWNATDACCNFRSSPVDDSAYLTAIIDLVTKGYNVDPKRIFVVGHSNGGFMSYRMACEHSDKIAAIVSLAGATFADTTRCKPSEPVNILQIHGTADEVIAFGGGQIFGHPFPSAATTVSTWAALDGCATTPAVASNPPTNDLDLEANLPGSETHVSTFANCRPGGAVALWTVEGGAHSPTLSTTFASDVIDFLEAHPKP